MLKHEWKNSDYYKKNKLFYRIMWVFGFIAMGLLWLLPEDIKMVNLIPLVLGIACFGIALWYEKKDTNYIPTKRAK